MGTERINSAPLQENQTNEPETMELAASTNTPRATDTPESQRIPCSQPRNEPPGNTPPESSEPPVPHTIQRLLDDGIHFKRVSPDIWRVSGFSATLDKLLSVAFSLDVPAATQDIIDGLKEAQIDLSRISVIQRRDSNNSWVLSFTSIEAKHHVTAARVHVLGNEINFSSTTRRAAIVKIFEAPTEMPDTVVIGRLSHYGKVLSFRREREGQFYNGVRSARMHLHKDIPSTIFIAGEKVRAWHPGQPRACRRCGQQDHIAKDCTTPRCWNCEKAGHRSAECPEQPLCGICLDDGHPLASCPFLACSERD